MSDISKAVDKKALPEQWQRFIMQQEQSEYFQSIVRSIAQQRADGVEIYPSDSDVLNAFSYCDIDKVKVVILGQDPYHGTGQAQGLAFSVNMDQKVPPSLVNIYKELADDIEGFTIPSHGELIPWAEQGVLLLNTVLTVQRGKAHSHSKLGWETFTDKVIDKVNTDNAHCVFMLWGSHAQSKGKNIDRDKHCVLNAVHPSPLSAYRGFLGCKHFSMANQWLVEKDIAPIDWQIESLGTMDMF